MAHYEADLRKGESIYDVIGELGAVQLADLAAHPIGLETLRPEQENRAFDTLKGKFCCDEGREKQEYVLKVRE